MGDNCLSWLLLFQFLDSSFIVWSCSKALEKASKNKPIIDAIGEPIVRGPWYNASLAVAHQRHSVSCTFPVSGPQGTGIFQLKAVRNGGLCCFSNTFSILFFIHRYVFCNISFSITVMFGIFNHSCESR